MIDEFSCYQKTGFNEQDKTFMNVAATCIKWRLPQIKMNAHITKVFHTFMIRNSVIYQPYFDTPKIQNIFLE